MLNFRFQISSNLVRSADGDPDYLSCTLESGPASWINDPPTRAQSLPETFFGFIDGRLWEYSHHFYPWRSPGLSSILLHIRMCSQLYLLFVQRFLPLLHLSLQVHPSDPFVSRITKSCSILTKDYSRSYTGI